MLQFIAAGKVEVGVMTRDEKKARSEQRQLQRFKGMLAKPDYKGYYAVMIGLVLLFQMFDLMATGIYSNLQEAIVLDFAGLPFNADISVGGAGYGQYQSTLSTITLANTIGFAFLGVVPFYKALADKLGRRPFFIINALLLGLAMFVGGTTNSLVIFVVVCLVIVFFTLHDMQILYITECVPDQKRATWQGIIAAVGSLANALVILMRLSALRPDGTLGQIPWRSIYMAIGIFGLVIFVLSALLLRESRPFLKSRIAYLETTPEQRRANAKEGKASDAGVIAGIKLMAKNPQLRWISIVTLIASAANNMVCSYNNSIMAQNGIDALGITVALLVTQAVSIPLNLIIGPLSDKIGRKWGSSICFILSGVGFAAMVFGGRMFSSSLACGIFCGAASGISICGYLAGMNITTLMMGESCPSSMRGSIIGVRSFFQSSAVLAMVLSGILFNYMPTGQVCLILSVPFLIAAGVVLLLKTKETKGLTMDEIEEQFN